MKYQFTFYDVEKQYMPISVTITAKPHEKFSEMKQRATIKVMLERQWTFKDLTEKYHFTKIRFRKIE